MVQILFGPAHSDGQAITGLPLTGPITAHFGSNTIPEHAGGHTGLDIGATTGAAVLAPAPGRVTAATAGPVFGTYITIAHAGGAETLYAHLSRIDVAVGQFVRRGDGLGMVGSTGLSTGPHLHWGLGIGGSPLIRGPHLRDPLAFLAIAPESIDIERTLRAAAHAIYGALQAAGAALGTHTAADFALFPEDAPEQAILAIQRAADPLIARYVAAG